MTGQLDAASRTIVFGTTDAPPPPKTLRAGALTFEVGQGSMARVAFDGVEIVRGIDAPIRDADWATLPRQILHETAEARGETAVYSCTFRAGDFDGVLKVLAEAAGTCSLTASIELTARAPVKVNRAGFIVLHPLAGVVGAPLRITHSDGTVEDLRFPDRISPGQPAFDIARMSHEVRGVAVDAAFTGEIFEMEDQRNWSDASFKTYCRPLGAPRPFAVARGEVVRQEIRLMVSRHGATAGVCGAPDRRGTIPAVECAFDPALGGTDLPEALACIGFRGVQLRLRAGEGFPPAWPETPERALEVVLPEGADAGPALTSVAKQAKAAGFVPDRVTALPKPYLASIQPEGPWPGGPTPADAADAARAAFPGAETGGGVLTNFTEFNRCPPKFDSDFVTFGTTAIVHDAGDRAVMETLEALPDIFASAQTIAGSRPVRLGLSSIGMRSNPYGADVAANPDGVRLEMALDDPRQRGLFAAAFAVGYAARAAEAGIACFAPAMATGPLGLVGADGVVPLFHVVRALGVLAGRKVTVSGAVPGDLITVLAPEGPGLRGLAANLSDGPRTLAAACTKRLGVAAADAARAADWLDTAEAAAGPVELAPCEVAFIYGDTK